MLKYFYTMNIIIGFGKYKQNSKTIVRSYGEIGSPWHSSCFKFIT